MEEVTRYRERAQWLARLKKVLRTPSEAGRVCTPDAHGRSLRAERAGPEMMKRWVRCSRVGHVWSGCNDQHSRLGYTTTSLWCYRATLNRRVGTCIESNARINCRLRSGKAALAMHVPLFALLRCCSPRVKSWRAPLMCSAEFIGDIR